MIAHLYFIVLGIPRAKPGTSASTLHVGVLVGSQCRSFYEQSESAAPHFPSLE